MIPSSWVTTGAGTCGARVVRYCGTAESTRGWVIGAACCLDFVFRFLLAYFKLGSEFYQQIDGMVMGSPLQYLYGTLCKVGYNGKT